MEPLPPDPEDEPPPLAAAPTGSRRVAAGFQPGVDPGLEIEYPHYEGMTVVQLRALLKETFAGKGRGKGASGMRKSDLVTRCLETKVGSSIDNRAVRRTRFRMASDSGAEEYIIAPQDAHHMIRLRTPDVPISLETANGTVEIVLIGDVLLAGFLLRGRLYCPCAHESLLSVDRFTEQFEAALRQGSGTAGFLMTLGTEEATVPLVKEGGLFYLQDPYAEETCCYQFCLALPDEVFPCSAPHV